MIPMVGGTRAVVFLATARVSFRRWNRARGSLERENKIVNVWSLWWVLYTGAAMLPLFYFVPALFFSIETLFFGWTAL